MEARKEEGSLLAFDQSDSWSIKYNLVWDKLLGVGLFDKEVNESEIQLYRKKMNRYGLPLNSRSDYTKLDWQAWKTVFTDNGEYSERCTNRSGISSARRSNGCRSPTGITARRLIK